MPRLTVPAHRALVQERQKQILDAAARIFAEKGFAGTTIRDVARAAGVSEGSIYLYFKNKQDLLVHLPRQFMQPPLEAFQQASVQGGTDPEHLLRFMAQNMVNVITQNRELMRVLFTSLGTMDDATRATYMREVPLYAMDLIQKYIRAQQAAGIFRQDIDPAIASRVLPGMMIFFLISQEIIQPENLPYLPYDELIPAIIQIFLHGIMNPGAPNSTPPQPGPAPAKKQIRRKQKIELT